MTQNGRSAGSRRPAAIVAAAVLITALSALLAGLAVVYLRGPSTSSQPALPLPARSTPATAPTSTPGVPVSPSPSVSATPFRYQPLWPFTSTAAAAAWQRAYREGGQQPWHLDPEQTALSFTTAFLGFTDINKVVSSTVQRNEARIAVGHAAGVAAVLHLSRIGQGTDAPWEVVGTVDTTLTLDHPHYGATVTSPLTASGLITGVDETIRLTVRQPSSPNPIGDFCCVPTGGTSHPWSARVTYKGATDPALTLITSTGGHVQSVERFAITALRPTR